MLRLAIVSCLLALSLASPFKADLDHHWNLFKSAFNKQYTILEEGARRITFEDNVHRISKHNLEFDMGFKSYRLGINEYADLSVKEFAAMMNGLKMNSKKAGIAFQAPSHVTLPDSVDWRKEGYVTDVKNQQQCGSCWAFSTTGSLEGQNFKKTGKLVSFSEQQLVDCSGDYGNQGCNGGLMDQAFDYIQKFGIETEADYPYTAEDGTCQYDKSKVVGHLTGHVDVKAGDEGDLKSAVATVGPVSVAIDASSFSFQFYSGGVYDEPNCSSSELDHGVLAVGYGTLKGVDYWLVKNSWGKTWGNDGYINMSRNKNNQCGIATQASYPTV